MKGEKRFMSLKKPSRARDEAYLCFIRAHDCISCGAPGPNYAHHARKLSPGEPGSSKTSDFTAVPLCQVCHTAEHIGYPMDTLELYQAAFDLLRSWMENNGNTTRSV